MKLRQLLGGWVLLSLLLAAPGCTLGASTPTPAPASQLLVAVSHPKVGERLDTGQEIKVQSTSVDPAGIARVELVINGETIWVDANAQPQPNTPFIVTQPWRPTTPGWYLIQVRAYNLDNLFGESPPLQIQVTAAGSAPATPTAVVSMATATSDLPTEIPPANAPATSSPTPTPKPEETTTTELEKTPTPSPTPTQTPPAQLFEPTGLEPEGRFKDIWFELGGKTSRLGYPTGPAITERDYAQQYF